VLFSFSWHRDEAALRHLRQILLSDGMLQHAARLHFLLNSADELAAFRSLVPDFDAMHFNNASLIDPERFVLATGPRRFHAVLNAKPLAFKRHELSVQVPERLFLSYDVQEPDVGATRRVDLEAFGAREIRRHLSAEDVAAALGEADVGLMLSAAEGACYASLEYLLCGLPVVSTRSLGGREDFYDPAYSRIVNDDPIAVRDAVADLRARLTSGEITRDAVRTRALAVRRAFLDALAARLQAMIDSVGMPIQAARLLDEAIAQGNKLQEHRNFWVTQLRVPVGAPSPVACP
jgi:glycosyltransferase involved in cell wall biosynthesis